MDCSEKRYKKWQNLLGSAIFVIEATDLLPDIFRPSGHRKSEARDV